MKLLKCSLLAACALAAGSIGAQALDLSLNLTLGTPRVPAGQALSPAAIATELSHKGFRVAEMYRKGPAYAVTATGPSGNKVLMMVDGGSGVILGLNVLTAVVRVVPETSPQPVFIDDRHPFGAVVPAVIYDTWQRYDEPQWVQAGPPAIAVEANFAPFHYAVPSRYVHASPRTGKSFAVAPKNYRGFKVQDHSGQQIHAAETRAQAAEEEAAFQSERADDADFKRMDAEQDAVDARNEAADARGEAYDANQAAEEANRNAAEMARQADEADKRAQEAEQQRDEVQKQLDEKNQADNPCSGHDEGCDPQNGGSEKNPTTDDNPNQDKPAEQEERPVPPEPQHEEPAPQPEPQHEEPAPQPEPQHEEPAPQPEPQQEQAPEPQQEQAQPEPQQEQQAEPEPQQQQDNSGQNGGDDSGDPGSGGN